MSRLFRLHLPRDIYDAMLSQAVAELPNECCGILAGLVEGGVGRVMKRHPLVNAAASGREYESEPRSMFEAQRAMRADGTRELAVYHSHPTSEAIPSRTDLARNYHPDVMNLIISLKEGEPAARAWWLTDVDYREAEWEIV
jgi:proteasome lid subunit RPN8/RPN11